MSFDEEMRLIDGMRLRSGLSARAADAAVSELEARVTYTLTLDSQSVAIIGQALGEQPFKLVSAVIANMQQQINAQEAAAKEVKEPAAETEHPQTS